MVEGGCDVTWGGGGGGTATCLLTGHHTDFQYRTENAMAAMRRRARSSSRAETLVTRCAAVRGRQPDRPAHAPRDSLLSWASHFSSFHGFLNWGALLLCLSSLRVCLENLLRYGWRVSLTPWYTLLAGDIPALLLLTLSTPLPALLALLLELGLSRASLSNTTATALHCTAGLATLAWPPFFIVITKCGILLALLACTSFTVILLKLVSYVQARSYRIDLG